MRMVEKGCQCWAPLLSAGCAWWTVSWLRPWCKQGAGAGCSCWVLSAGCARGGNRVLGAGCARVWCCELACRCWLLALWRTQGAAGLLVLIVCVVQIGCWCRVLALAVRVVETRHAVLHVKIGVAANAGCSPEKSFACFCYLGSMLV